MEGSVHEQLEQTMPVAWQHNKDLGDCMAELYNKRLWTDVKFHCNDHDENERIHAHKIVLAARSPVFQAMFFGPCASGKDEIDLDNVQAEIMDLLLSYIYSDTVTLSEDNAPSVLEMAHYYQVTNLVQFCADYLTSIISFENASEILTLAMRYEVTPLRDACCNFIDKNADKILGHEGFLELSEEYLLWILKGDTFYAKEDDIFIKAEEWAERKLKANNLEKTGRNIRKTLGGSFFYVRLPTMSFETLMKCTHKKGYFAVEEYEDIIEFINKISAASVKSNSCVARLPTEETMNINYEDGEANISDNINTTFQIFVSRDVKLTNVVVTEIRKYLKYNKLSYTDENCSTIPINQPSTDLFLSQHHGRLLKVTRYPKAVQVLKEAFGEDLSDKPDIVITGTFKVTCQKVKLFFRGKSEKPLKLNDEDAAENGGALDELYEEKEDADDALYAENEDELIFEQDFQLQSAADVTCRRIVLREPLTLTKDASPYTIKITMHYGCTSGVKMKTICSNTKTVRSKFGQLQVQDIAGQFAGIKTIGFENISNR
ncbi:BTB/POZ domain-containing protein 1-like [Mercenaria mercenaria]|uniref:BTB/POZ domain-containing protein 1-like n=1 Tax=Mercenaria mercenaria TaxID=6596 RepID=UPI00234F6D44|nr:BTB/POZ domain-containing protein 1-like [Mercenaria mercenaria]